MIKFYVNGIETDHQKKVVNGFDIPTDSNVRIDLANKSGGDHFWLGEYYLVAIYSRALDINEVKQNFKASP